MEKYPLLKLKFNSIKKCTTETVNVNTYADKLKTLSKLNKVSQVTQEIENIPFFVKKDKKLNIKHSWSDDKYWNDDEDDEDDEDIDYLNEKRDLEAYNNDVYWYE